MTADRDDLAALLDQHEWCKYGVRSQPPRWWPMCSCGESFRNLRYDEAFKAHRAHVAQMVLESDWLRDVKADVWDEGYKCGAADWAAVNLKPPEVAIASNTYRTKEETQ